MFMRAVLTLLTAIDEPKFTAIIAELDREYIHIETTGYVAAEGSYSTRSYRLHSRANPLCVHLHG